MHESRPELDLVIQMYQGKKGAMIPLLQDVQKLEGFLSKDTMRYVADKTGLRLAEIYGVATFYAMFRLKPQGKHVIRVCKGTACHVSGANGILDAVRADLKLGDQDDTTDDALFTVMEVACLGCCSLAPVIMVDDTTYGKLEPKHIPDILKKYV